MDVLRVNVEEEDESSLTERFGDNYNLIHKKRGYFQDNYEWSPKLWLGSDGRFEIYGDGGKNYW